MYRRWRFRHPSLLTITLIKQETHPLPAMITFVTSARLLASLRTRARQTGSTSRQEATKGTRKRSETKRNIASRPLLSSCLAFCLKMQNAIALRVPCLLLRSTAMQKTSSTQAPTFHYLGPGCFKHAVHARSTGTRRWHAVRAHTAGIRCRMQVRWARLSFCWAGPAARRTDGTPAGGKKHSQQRQHKQPTQVKQRTSRGLVPSTPCPQGCSGTGLRWSYSRGAAPRKNEGQSKHTALILD